MKFSDIKQEDWPEIKSYFDTCMLPLTGLTGREEPWQVTKGLEKLRDLMDHVEIPFRGRVVTYPSIQYIMEQQSFVTHVNELSLHLKELGFKHVIIITANSKLSQWEFENADLKITFNHDMEMSSEQLRSHITQQVENLWNMAESSM